MRMVAIGRSLRMLRIRRDWRQSDVAARAGISRAAVGRHENGIIGSVGALERHAALFALRMELRLSGRAGQLVRLADEEHAAIVETLADWFNSAGFVMELEASFNEWGERGRIDLLAYDPAAQTLVIVEVKTQLLDLQELLGGLNVKERLSATVAERHGWRARRRVTLLAVADTFANRKIVREHPSSFSDCPARRLTRPSIHQIERRALHWVSALRASREAWIGGRQRIRQKAPAVAAAGPSAGAQRVAGPVLTR